MRQFFNQFSFVVLSVVVLAVAAVVLLPRGWQGAAALAAIAAVVAIAQRALRTGGSSVASQDALARQVARGEPVLIEFYSDY